MSTTVTNPTSPWVVPAGVTSISITVCAAGGGGGNGDDGTTGSDLSIASAVFGGIFHCYGGAGGGIDGNGADGDVTFGSGWSGLAGGADNGGAGDDGSGGSGGKIWNNALAVTAGQSFTYGTDTSGTNGQLPDVGVGAGGANDGGPGSVVIVYSIGGGSTSVVAGATGKAVAAAQAIVKELMATGSAGVGKVTGALAVNAIIPPMNASVVGAGQEIATPIVKEPLAADVAGVAALHGVLSVAGSQITATAQMLGLAAANAALSVFSPLVLTNVVPPQTALLLTGEDAVALGKTEVFQQIDQRIRWVQDGARFTGANAFATNTWMAFDDTLDFRIEAEVSMDVGSHDCSPLFMYWSEAYYRRIDFYQTDVGVDDHDYRYGIGDWGMGQTLALELGQHVCIAFEFIAATRTLTSYYKYPTDSEWTLGHASVPYWPAVVPDDLPAPPHRLLGLGRGRGSGAVFVHGRQRLVAKHLHQPEPVSGIPVTFIGDDA